MAMGDRKTAWEWEAPVWAKGDAKRAEDDASKVSLIFSLLFSLTSYPRLSLSCPRINTFS